MNVESVYVATRSHTSTLLNSIFVVVLGFKIDITIYESLPDETDNRR